MKFLPFFGKTLFNEKQIQLNSSENMRSKPAIPAKQHQRFLFLQEEINLGNGVQIEFDYGDVRLD